MNDQFKLSREIEAVMALKASLGEMIGDDAQLLADTMEGQTDIHEAAVAVIESIDDDEVLLAGIAARVEELSARKQRIGKRIAAKRTAVEHALSVAGIKKIEAPLFTLSIRNTARGLIVENEAAIPAAFWKTADPTINKAAIRAALKDGEAVPGASLDNGGISLVVHRR